MQAKYLTMTELLLLLNLINILVVFLSKKLKQENSVSKKNVKNALDIGEKNMKLTSSVRFNWQK